MEASCEVMDRFDQLREEAKDLQKYCQKHRQTIHRCDCPFDAKGVCCLKYMPPGEWAVKENK